MPQWSNGSLQTVVLCVLFEHISQSLHPNNINFEKLLVVGSSLFLPVLFLRSFYVERNLLTRLRLTLIALHCIAYAKLQSYIDTMKLFASIFAMTLAVFAPAVGPGVGKGVGLVVVGSLDGLVQGPPLGLGVKLAVGSELGPAVGAVGLNEGSALGLID